MNTVTIKCVWGANLKEPFERTLEVSDDMPLGELHDEIQDFTDFDNDHLFAFFIARRHFGRREELVDVDDWRERADVYYRLPLNQVLPLPKNMKLFYWFDFGDDWMFQITKRGKSKPDEKGATYPRLVHEVGPKPVQYPAWEE